MKQHDVRMFSADKILNHIDRINAWLKGENPYPVTVEIDLTDVCNHACPACTGASRGSKHFLEIDFACHIIDQLADVGVRAITFTGGGEPLCHSKFMDIFMFAVMRGLDIGLITNGTLINEINYSLLKHYSTWIRISLDAGTADLYKKTHGMHEKAFIKVLQNAGKLSEGKRKATIGIGYLTCKDTISEMNKATIESKNIGADYIQFRPFHNDKTDISTKYQLCKQHETNNFKVLCSLHKYNMMNAPERLYKKCYGQQFATTICADGKMYVCCHFRKWKKYCIGDLNKQSFEEIWHSDRRKKVVKNIDFQDCVPLCRCDTFNHVLWNIKQEKEHKNFL